MKEIALSQNKYAIVDDDIFSILNSYKWYVRYNRKKYYASRGFTSGLGEYKKMFMHHAVIGQPINEYVVDHINGNSLDNRRCNLRIVSRLENQRNTKVNRRIEFNGINKTVSEWAEELKIPSTTIMERLKTNKPIRQVLSTEYLPNWSGRKHTPETKLKMKLAWTLRRKKNLGLYRWAFRLI